MRRQPRSNIEWLSWGASDPLYAVASLAGRNRRGDNPWTDDDFYAHGAQNWEEYRPQWESYGVTPTSCVEIGCGAGRITKQLSRYFREVHAVDVSRKMIEYAQRNLHSDNVSFYVTDGIALPLADCSVTAAFSSEVFQHFNDVSFGERYLVELYRVMKADESLMIHLPVYTWPDAMRRTFSGLYSVWRALDSLQADIRRALIKSGLGHPFMFGVKYESKRLHDFLWELGFRDIEIRFFQISGEKGNPAFRSYLFARKSPGPMAAKSS